MLRVLIVDDSAVDRRLLTHILDGDPQISVVGEAVNGAQAVEMALRLRPDVITMDIQMPVMDGFDATARIMEESPTPIVIVGSSVEGPDRAFRALNAGALTLIPKPPGPRSRDFAERAQELTTTIKLMADVKLVSRRSAARRPRERPSRSTSVPSRSVELVAMAASTGGPSALAMILGDLPANFPAPVVVVQHIAGGFEDGLADWLGRVSHLDVALANPGDKLRAGRVLIARQGRHMGVSRNGTVVLGHRDRIDGQAPSATYLFRSVAEEYGARALGVVLTGMGSDGRDGAARLRSAGGYVVAQDAESSVVYGMPAEAAAAGAVNRMLPLDEIAGFIAAACRVSPGSDPGGAQGR